MSLGGRGGVGRGVKNGVSASSVPHFIVDWLAFKDYPRSDLFFFLMEILEGVKWQTSHEDYKYNGPKQQCDNF